MSPSILAGRETTDHRPGTIAKRISLCAVIPVHNEAAAIASVVRSALAHCEMVLVVDDGSSDDSSALARAAGALVLEHGRRRGKGAAIRSALEFLAEGNQEAIVLLDGDGQHDPDDIPRLVEAHREGADLVLGDRSYEFAKMSFSRRVTNRVMTKILRRGFLRYGARLSDSQCGFRLISARALRELRTRAPLRSCHFEIESELLVSASRLGLRIADVPIAVARRHSPSKIRPARDTVRFLRLLLRMVRTSP